MMSVNIPFITASKEDADHYVEAANHDRKMNGCFFHRYTTSEYMYMYDLYQFHDSLPASKAKLEDFSAGHKTVDTDTILLPNTEKTFYIDLRLVTYSQAKEAAKKPQKKPQKSRRRSHKKATNSIKHLVSSSKEINKSQLLVRIDELLTSGELSMSGKLSMSGELPIPMPAPLSSLPEVATCFRS